MATPHPALRTPTSADPNVRRFERLFDYEARCTPLVLDSLRRAERHVREAGLAALVPPWARAVEIFAHVQAARELWLSRVSTLGTPPPDGVFPVRTIDACETSARAMDDAWARFVRGLTGADLERPVQYTSTEGHAYESALADILTHVVNHSSYHRGQIAHLLAHTGTKPAVTDFIAFARTAL
jgi:uncharacterized damage-inducible protein DinB